MSADSVVLFNNKLSALKLLNIEELSCCLYWTIPPIIYELTSLKKLQLWSDQDLFHEISGLINLEELEFTNSGAKKDSEFHLPRSIRKLKCLQRLTLTRYFMRNPNKELAKLTSLDKLEKLQLWHCEINKFPESITRLKNLRFIYFISGTFTTLPKSFFKMKNMRAIYLPESFPDNNFADFRRKLPLCMFEKHVECFTAGTMITMADGSTKPIELIQNDDIVLSWNFEEKKVDSSRVIHVMKHACDEKSLLHFTTQAGQGFYTTFNHPIYVGAGEFAQAGMVTENMQLYLLNDHCSGISGNTFSVSTITRTTFTVYNFGTTKGNYFANGILVHNK